MHGHTQPYPVVGATIIDNTTAALNEYQKSQVNSVEGVSFLGFSRKEVTSSVYSQRSLMPISKSPDNIIQCAEY